MLVPWIDLADVSGKVKLRGLGLSDESGQKRKHLVIIGLASDSQRWAKAIEILGFTPSPSNKYLIRPLTPGEKLSHKSFHRVWPNARIVQMEREEITMEKQASVKKRLEEEHREEAQTDDIRSASIELGAFIRLGRNADGDVVYKSPLGRFIDRDGARVQEGAGHLSPALFLRANSIEEEWICADGFVQSLVAGEVQRAEDLHQFATAVYEGRGNGAESIDAASTAIDAAVVRYLTQNFQTAQDAFGESARLYEFMPAHQGSPRGAATLPIPLTVMSQRLLGDTSGKTVAFPDAYDGATFAFLPQETNVKAYRGDVNISAYANGNASSNVEWGDVFDPATAGQVDAIFINKDPQAGQDGHRNDYGQTIRALRSLKAGGRAVIALAAGSRDASGQLGRDAKDFFDYLSRTYTVDAAFEIPAQMTSRSGANRAQRVIAITNTRPAEIEHIRTLPVLHSWDECKSYVDEAIIKMDLREAQADGIDVGKVIRENEYQRPYLAFSKVGEASTMVPKNLQGPIQSALSRLEAIEGEIDSFVERELGFLENTLSERFSPEQVDAVGLAIFRQHQGRGIIIADETGIGKGRILSAMAVWANKNGRPVIFVTDKANLFSDLCRDLRHIEEWGRFRPMLTNNGASLLDDVTREVIHEGTPNSEIKAIMDNMTPLDALGYNLVFTTYSQMAGEESIKAEWILQQSPNALVAIDEAHVAAGSDSNMSRVVVDLATRAWGVIYSSATWAKSSENLHIFSRALPEAVNITTLTATMRSGGEAVSEIFSSMLAADGAFIRREHDLSKLELFVHTDQKNVARNELIADKVAEILGAMTFVGGEINRLMMRSNNDTLAALKRARDIHAAAAHLMLEGRKTRRRNGEVVNADIPTRLELFRPSFGAGTVLYQVMRRVISILNVDNVADLAKDALSKDIKPVIVIEDTAESFVREIMDERTIPAMEGEKAIVPSEIPPPTIRDLLMKVVRRMGVVRKKVIDTNAMVRRAEMQGEGEIDVETVLDGADEGGDELSLDALPGITDAQREVYLEGIKRIVKLIEELPPLPLNVIDLVRGRLMSEGIRVQELTGRGRYLDMPEHLRMAPIESDWTQSGSWQVRYRKKNKRVVNETVADFNSGDVDALVINRSVAAGISLHASPRFEDRRQRMLIEMQIPENPTDRIQLYGRVNRFDQVIGPLIAMASAGIYGETRGLMMANKKLERLSANTRSSKDTALGNKLIVDFLNVVGDDVCERFLRENTPIRQRLGISEEELESSGFSAAAKLSARVVLLRVVEQKMVYDEIHAAYEEEIARLDLAGKNPLKTKELDIRARTVQSRIAIGVEMEGAGSAFDGPVYIKQIAWNQELRPIDWFSVTEMIRDSRQNLLKLDLAQLRRDRLDTNVTQAEDVAAEVDGDVNGIQIAPMSFDEVLEGRTAEQARVGAPKAEKHELTRLSKAMGVSAPSLSARHDVAWSGVLSAQDAEAVTSAYRKSQAIYSTLDLSKPQRILSQVLGDRARLALAGTKFEDLEQALRSSSTNAVRLMWAKKIWVDKYFSQLQPGCVIGINPYEDTRRGRKMVEENVNLFRKAAMITGLVPPPPGKEAQISKWKVQMVIPGEEGVRSYSLGKLLDDVSLMFLLRADHLTNIELTGGPVMNGFAFTGAPVVYEFDPVERIKAKFEEAEVGVRERKAVVLEGNMYLASEWAQATKMGRGIIYTDENGIRRRAIEISRDSVMGHTERDMFQHMPVRLWVPKMVSALVDRLWSGEEVPPNFGDKGYLLKTDFASCMSDSFSREGVSRFVCVPDEFVGMSTTPKEVARITRAVKSEAKKLFALEHPDFKNYSEEDKQAAKASMLQVRSTSKKGKPSMVYIDTPSKERMQKAVELLSQSVGLELYLWPSSPAGLVAKEVVEQYFTQRREAAIAEREALERRHVDGGQDEVNEAPNRQEAVAEVQ